MIKINKTSCPSELDAQKKIQLTRSFKQNKTRVWNKKYIKRALLTSSHNKCAYCECKLNIESNYLEVEHYHDKHKYPDKVVEWDNLLPSCKRCNVNKGTYDTLLNPFINPSTMDPKKHLRLNNFRLEPKTVEATNTISNLVLNDLEKVVMARVNIALAVEDRLQVIFELAQSYVGQNPKSNATKNSIITQVQNIMSEGLPESEYAAITATSIINNYDFKNLKRILLQENLWNDEMNNKFIRLNSIKLDK